MRRSLHHFVFFSFLFILSPSPTALADNLELPDFGAASAAGISPMEEQRMGEDFMRSVRQVLKLVEDPLVTDYIQHLGTQLTNYSDNRRYNFNFFVVDDPNINAFAGPAGNIGIHSGLILSSSSESELASVMAHEIAHVTQYHIHRSIQKARSMGLPTAAAIIAAILLSASDPDAANAMITATVAGSAQSQLNFSRQHELEADRVGIKLLSDAGYDPRAMPSFFETLYKQTRVMNSGLPEFLSTHPVTENRIADTRNRAEQYPYRQFADSVEFHLTRARLKYLQSKNHADQVRQYQQALTRGNYANEQATRYGLVLAYVETGQLEPARKEISRLIETDHERVPYLIALADIEYQSGDTVKALTTLKNTLALYPDNLATALRYTEILLTTDQWKDARNIARGFLQNHPGEPAMLQLLSQLEEKAGHPGLAYEYLAESLLIRGQISHAIEILNQALRQNDLTDQDRDRIQAKLVSYKGEFTRQKQEIKTPN